MNLIIIRTCPRDEKLAMRCYKTFQDCGIEGEYIFFAEEGEYKEIINHKVFYHPGCNNFGGRLNVVAYLEYLNRLKDELNLFTYDTVVISDSDIIIIKNFLPVNCDYGGVQDKNNPNHFSGQLLVMKSYILMDILDYKDIYGLTEDMIGKGLDIADDTVFGEIAAKYTDEKCAFEEDSYWIHTKII